MPIDPGGFWGVPTASIDWCEQNYAVLPWVAEFWNTLSSFAMVGAGLVGVSTRRFAAEIRVAFALLILVGLGSVAFHATLRFGLQMLDELPMLYLVTWLVWLLVENGPTRRLGSWFPAALVAYVLTARDVAGPFTAVPSSMAEKAKLDSLSYSSLQEELGEKFHISPDLLVELNYQRSIANAGDEIMVPNVAAAAPRIDAREVVVSAGDRSVTVIAPDGSVFARYPATTGSSHDPLPLGTWRIDGITHAPKFHYNPRLFWDANASDRAATITPGPNNPVGVVWIDLSKPHYGIHGTPEPSTIGHTQSHGCIRLTNWSAEELSHIVKAGTPAILRE